MTEPTFDRDGYPTQETLEAIRTWPHEDAAACLDFVKAAWHWPECASYDISAAEREVIHAEDGERFLRLATGGWSGNEALLTALRENFILSGLCWRLSTCGGLEIWRYPR